MKNTIQKILCILLIVVCAISALAGVPLNWSVETSRVQPVQFDAVHGETLDLQADFTSYAKPLNLSGAFALFYQTNGMGSAWWQIPATVASNRVTAVFAPTNDPGASAVSCFLGSTGSIYRAAFTLRFRHGPGATPNAIDAPVPILDLASTTVVNPPWPTTNDFQTATNVMQTTLKDYVDAEIGGAGLVTPSAVTNISQTVTASVVTKDYVEGLGIESGLDTNAVRDIVAPATNAVMTAATAAFYPKASGEAWSSYWDGDEVRVTITNYYGQTDIPHLYMEQRTNETGTAVYKIVWDEATRWTNFLGTNWTWTGWAGAYAFKTNMLAQVESIEENKADRAWGFYDSHTGEYAPDGYTQISSTNILVAAGMGYQRTITTSGDTYWVLTANEPFLQNGTTNGAFQVMDADGNVQVEIIKGDKRTVGARCNGVAVTNRTLYAVYSVTASEHPTIEVCADLSSSLWYAEDSASCPATVVWRGSSGAYVAAITPTSASATKIFVRATYLSGGETYVHHACPVGMSKIVLNGTTYTLGTATIDGHTVLTLTTGN